MSRTPESRCVSLLGQRPMALAIFLSLFVILLIATQVEAAKLPAAIVLPTTAKYYDKQCVFDDKSLENMKVYGADWTGNDQAEYAVRLTCAGQPVNGSPVL